MNNNEFFALHITWTCYGTWLPGDPRGHVSNRLTKENVYLPKQNGPGTDYAEGDAWTWKNARSHQKGETVYLTGPQAELVCQSMVRAAESRSWRILRAAVMRNHVHVVVTDCPANGPELRRILKGVSQSDLTKANGSKQRWWTAGGSDRYKNTVDAALAAIQYDANQTGILAEIVDMQVVVKRTTV
jgi:REP element-mobilizing transposase RayT